MAEVVTVPAAWALPGAMLLAALALAGAVVDGAFVGRRGHGGVHGTAVPFVESARLLRQRRRVPPAADRLLWRIGTGGAVVAASLMVVVVPIGPFVLVDIPVGVVWFTAVDVTVWALVWLAGWGPNAVYPLVGGYRFLAQALAYELPLMVAVIAPAVAAGSLRLTDVAQAQAGLWFAVWMPLAFGIFCLGVVAFSVWGPFRAAVAGDIAGGVLAESSGVDRLLSAAGRYALLAAGATVAVPLYLGGGAGPLLPPWLWVPVKALVVLVGVVALARRLPVVRPDRFLEAGWLVLLPLALLQLVIVAVVTQ